MKPYKIHNTWVDLDHVIIVDDDIYYNTRSGYGVYGSIQFLFKDNPVKIYLSNWDEHYRATDGAKVGEPKWNEYIQKLRTEWEAFKTAWTNKDKTNLDSNTDAP